VLDVAMDTEPEYSFPSTSAQIEVRVYCAKYFRINSENFNLFGKYRSV
jgi:hypothetical protein